MTLPNNLPSADGFSTRNLNDHVYSFYTEISFPRLSRSAVTRAIKAFPTPGVGSAGPDGRRIDVGPIVRRSTNFVRSYTIPSPDPSKYTDFVVNYTIEGQHELAEGYVLMYGEVKNGTVVGIRTYGEGHGFAQDPALSFIWCSQVAPTWRPVHSKIIVRAIDYDWQPYKSVGGGTFVQ